MKKTSKIGFKGFVLGVMFSTILMSTAVGTGLKGRIDVVLNPVKIFINGEKQDMENLIYKGKTYIAIRDFSTSLDKTVNWDQGTKTINIDNAKEIHWDDNNMHFDRIGFGDNLEKIVYRIGEPDEVIKKDDGSIIYKCVIPPVKEYSVDENGNRKFVRISTPEETVFFYTNGPEQIKREKLYGVYKIVADSNWSAIMGTSNDVDGSYNGLLKTYGIPDSREVTDNNGIEKVWYQLKSNETRYLFFEIKDGNIISHGMEIKY